jgi:hypothetical protein
MSYESELELKIMHLEDKIDDLERKILELEDDKRGLEVALEEFNEEP